MSLLDDSANRSRSEKHRQPARPVRRSSRPPAAALVMALLVTLATPSIALAGDMVPTGATLFAGHPSGESGARGVLVVPGTVLPNLGTLPGKEAFRGEEDRAWTTARLSDQLVSTFRLQRVEVLFSQSFPALLDEPAALPLPSPDSSLEITVELLGFDRTTATYRVRFVENGELLADSRVAAQRGGQAVIGAEGEGAPYLFLALSPAPVGAGPVKVEGDIHPPKRMESVMPTYPEEARKQKAEGMVILQVVIDEAGRVGDVRVLQGQPYGLSEAAEEAVRQWRFEPARSPDGDPVSVWYNLTILFRLDEDEKPGGEKATDGG